MYVDSLAREKNYHRNIKTERAFLVISEYYQAQKSR